MLRLMRGGERPRVCCEATLPNRRGIRGEPAAVETGITNRSEWTSRPFSTETVRRFQVTGMRSMRRCRHRDVSQEAAEHR
jgi:hypothetical protein